MTYRIEALEALRNKVKAGAWFPGLAQRSMGGVPNYHSARAAFNGDLNAAQKLHEAMLPDWGWRLEYNEQAVVWELNGNREVFGGWCSATAPARAWLIAILEALIAIEKDKPNDQ